jgi:peptide/nickel transport system substrate-binding protein
VRRALTLAINRRELLGVLNLPPDLPVSDVIFAQRHWNSLPDALPHDPELAGRLLDEVGWRDEDGGGIRRREGVHFQFDLLVTAEEEREAVYIQNQLREIGVQMDITRRSEWVQVFQQIREGEFEAAISRYLMELPSTMGQRRFFGEGNYIGYQNERVFELLEMGAATQNPRILDTIYLELMEIFQSDLPAIFLHPVTSTHIVRRHLAGLSSPYRADPVWYMEHIWLEDPVLR